LCSRVAHEIAKYRPATFPTELACDFTAADGTKLHLRPIRPDDADSLIKFHEGLSPSSIYRRYFFTHPKLSALEVERFTCVDYVDRLALVVEDNDRLVAVCRYERTPDTSEAEVAFVVADKYQHHGIGTLLLERLADAARCRGLTSFVAFTLTENRDMLKLFADSGFTLTSTREGETITLRFSIESDDTDRASRKARHNRTRARLLVADESQDVVRTEPEGVSEVDG
jgi:GNAT superfamily N-acetyltransferase